MVIYSVYSTIVNNSAKALATVKSTSSEASDIIASEDSFFMVILRIKFR